jgi:AcrR family transcriptional regulator
MTGLGGEKLSERSQGGDTRETILLALTKVIATKGITEFSVQSVADEAGVAHRTVYRYFPSRETLLEGLAAYLEHTQNIHGLPGAPRDFDELVEAVPGVFRFFDENRDLVRATVLTAMAIGLEPGVRRTRTEAFLELVGREAPHLSEIEQKRWALALRALSSSETWFSLTERFGMTSAEAGETVSDALGVLVSHIRGGEADTRGGR